MKHILLWICIAVFSNIANCQIAPDKDSCAYTQFAVSYIGKKPNREYITREPMGYDICETPPLAKESYANRIKYYNPVRWKFFNGYVLPIEALKSVSFILEGTPADNWRIHLIPKENTKPYKHQYPLTYRTYEGESVWEWTNETPEKMSSLYYFVPLISTLR